MKIYLADNIRLFARHSKQKAQIVERLNRTIKGIMFSISQTKTQEGILMFFKTLHQNTMHLTSYHRNIKMAPKNVHRDKETQVWINLYKKRLPCKQRKRSKFSVGDFVRLSIKKASLMKRYQEIWIEEVFIVDSIVYGNPTTYKMKDQDNEPMQGTFYEQEL